MWGTATLHHLAMSSPRSLISWLCRLPFGLVWNLGHGANVEEGRAGGYVGIISQQEPIRGANKMRRLR